MKQSVHQHLSCVFMSNGLSLTYASVPVVSQRCAGGSSGDRGGEGAASGGLCCHQEGLHNLPPRGRSRRAPGSRRRHPRPNL